MKPDATATSEDPVDDKDSQVAPPPAQQTPASPTAPTPAAPPEPATTEAGDATAAAAVSRARTEAAELATIAAQAARLGLTIDLAEAVQKGVAPDALRASVLNQLAARSDAAAIVAVPPPKSAAPESPLLAAVKRANAVTKPA